MIKISCITPEFVKVVCRLYIPLLNSTFPSLPPLLQNSSSRLCARTACLWGNAAKARGSAKTDVVRIRPTATINISQETKQAPAQHLPRFTGRVNLGLALSHSIRCNLTKIKGGIAITGVEFSTRLSAVSPTASVAAFRLFPRLCCCTSTPSFPFCAFSSSLSKGYTSIPRLISSPRMRNTFSAPADETAAKGTKRVSVSFVTGERRFRRGTRALRPRATVQEAETARK